MLWENAKPAFSMRTCGLNRLITPMFTGDCLPDRLPTRAGLLSWRHYARQRPTFYILLPGPTEPIVFPVPTGNTSGPSVNCELTGEKGVLPELILIILIRHYFLPATPGRVCARLFFQSLRHKIWRSPITWRSPFVFS